MQISKNSKRSASLISSVYFGAGNKAAVPHKEPKSEKAVVYQLMRSKAAIARAIYAEMAGQPSNVIWKAIEQHAALSPKAAMTYFYNCRREENAKADLAIDK